MGIPLIEVDPRRLRALIARLWLRDADIPERLGGVTLRAHQCDAAVRLRHAFAEFGGAMLADEAGLGKTYTALAAARHARSLLVVGPASLRSMWRDALRAADIAATLVSFEGLSRGSSAEVAADFVIVDEAHHARNPTTRRYRALAELAANATVLLLTATPIHNRPGELAALLGLFLGERAATLDAAARSRCIIRRSHSEPAGLPQLPGISLPRWLPLSHDDAIPRALLAMPPPCPPRDGGAADSLVLLSLLRAWGSSDGALRRALRRRIGRAESLIAAIEAGRHPSRAELRAWREGDDAVQLAFPELVAAEPPAVDACALQEALRAHADGARDVIRALGPNDARDAERVTRLLELRAEVGDARIVAFTQFADTVTSLFRGLRRSAAVAALTARGAEVAGGRLGRLDALRRFAPRASGTADPRPAERITMLLTTDVSSEGVNLQDASVVVHLDLPWTAARLEQRVGRVRRMGSTHEIVRVYAMAPPASADALLGVRRILDRKAGDARRLVGAMPLLIPGGDVADPSPGPAQVVEELRRAVRAWSVAEPCDVPPSGGAPLVAGVRADRSGVLALYFDRRLPVLVAATGSGPLSTDPATLLEAIASASGGALELSDDCRSSEMARLGRWLSERRGSHAVSGTVVGGRASPRARVLRRIARIVADAPAHRRPAVVAVAAAARAAVERARGAGAEQQLLALGVLDEPDDAWLRRCADEPWRRGGATGGRRDDHEDLQVICVLVLQPHGSQR